MSYPPRYHLELDENILFDAIEALRHATLVVMADNRNLVSFTPFLLDRERRVLRGHIARRNPQADCLDGRRVDAIFHGPHAYISPRLNGNDDVPTWNYVNVHVAGRAQAITDEARSWQLLRDMIETFEGANTDAYLAGYGDRLRRLLPGIQAFEIAIDETNGRFKLGRNDPPNLQQRTFEALRAETPPSLRAWLETLAPSSS